MAADDRLDNWLSRNKAYASTYEAPPTFAQVKAKGPPPHPAMAIISCCDGRLYPEDYLSLERGEALVIRNAGGRAFDAIRSLVVLDVAVNIGTVIIIHHTDCGLTHATNDGIRQAMKERVPAEAEKIDAMEFGEIKDMHQSVRDDITLVKESPYFKSDLKVLGYVFDLSEGKLIEVA